MAKEDKSKETKKAASAEGVKKAAAAKGAKKEKAEELKMHKGIKEEREKARALELEITKEEEKRQAKELEFQRTIEAEREKVRKLELQRAREEEKRQARELELKGNLDAEKAKISELRREREREEEAHKARELELERKIEEGKERAVQLQRQAREEEKRHKARMLELERGIESEKRRFEELKISRANEKERNKARELELAKSEEAEKQKAAELEIETREEAEKHRERERELEEKLEAERQVVRGLERRRNEEAAKQRASESEIERSLDKEKQEVRRLELQRIKEAEKHKAKVQALKRGVGGEKQRAEKLGQKIARDTEKYAAKELRLRKRIEAREEKARQRKERREQLLEQKALRSAGKAELRGARWVITRLLSVIIVILIVIMFLRFRQSGEYSRTVPLMGTFMQVKVYGNGFSRGELTNEVDEAMVQAQELEKKFSIYDPKSEINELNDDRMRVVSLELFNLINKAKRIGHITDGAFDITVAPILKANGFYKDMPAEIRNKIPTSLDGVGIENVTLKLDNSVWLRNGAWIDLSGIAKGAIVDYMRDFLRGRGMYNILINAGGDIYCGKKVNGEPWLIGLREPGSEQILLTLALQDMAVATSGDYENVVFDKKTGRAISHIIDPIKESPIKETFSSVTVIAPACTDADALATGMMVMGKDKAIALANEMEDISIIIVTGSGDQRSIDFSEGADKFVRTGR